MKKKFDWVEARNKKYYFICKGCMETITKPKNWSKEEGYCISCFEINEAMKNNKCLECGGINPVREYWGVCKNCWDKSSEEIEKENQKLFEREAKRLGITVKEYKKKMMSGL